MSEVKIRYVGHQPKKRASVLVESSNIIWDGHGDVQLVPQKVADALLQPLYKSIWARVEDVAEQPDAGLGTVTIPTVPTLQPGGETPPTEPEAPALTADELTTDEVKARIEEIIQVWPKLALTDFNPSGKPKLVALRQILNRDVFQAEVDAAFEVIQGVTGTSVEDPAAAEPEAAAPATESVPE
jgi:hypothetical protein